jgi:hypothetical protein
MINTDIYMDNIQCAADGYKGLLALMRDAGVDKVKCSFTFLGQDAHRATLTLKDVERLVAEENVNHSLNILLS